MAFQLKSHQQIMRDMIASFLANSPVNDINKGSNISTLLEAAATEDFNQYFQMLSIISDFVLDNTTGEDLDNRALEFGLDGRIQPKKAFTTVTIFDTAFSKVATKIHAGLAGPVSGSNVIFADNASAFTASGTIIIGRGTANVETITYTSIVTGLNFDTINLGSNLANDHGTDETIVLAQGGNRVIGANAIVKVPATDFSPDVLFATEFETTIQDGENEVTGINVTAVVAGTAANVPAGSIIEFDTEPFATAVVVNDEAVTNGVDLETDQELRDRIKATIQSLSRGTSISIKTGVVGIVDPVDNKRVVSANLIDTTDVADIVTLIIDDGTGFEPSFEGKGFESVLEDSTGGEEFLQLDLFPIVKATVITINTEPFSILNNQTLIYKINNVEETVTFIDSDFRIPGSASAQEIITAINNRATLVEARTTEGRTKIELKAKINVNEGVEIVGGTANATNILNFPVGLFETLKLYKFDGQTLTILEKDGSTALLESGSLQPYNFSVAPSFLDIQMDGETLSSGDATAGSGLNTLIDSDLSSRYPNDTDLPGEHVTFLTGVNAGTTHRISVYTSASDQIDFTSGITVSVGDEYQIDDVERIFFSNQANEDFVNPSSATAQEVANVINRRLKGVAGLTNSLNKVKLTSKIENSTSSKIKIIGGTANVILSFSTAEVVGKNKDYTFNRFNGQIKLNNPLAPGVFITSGTRISRGFLIGSFSQPFLLTNGDTIDVKIDGESVAQTITFLTADFTDISTATAVEIVAVINTNLVGGVAEVTSDNKISIRTNTFDSSLGSIEITAATGNAINIGFLLNSVANSIPSHFAAALSGNTEPFNFVEGDKLVVVLDNNPAGRTFDIAMDLDGDVNTVTGTPDISFTANITSLSQSFTNKFLLDDELNDMKLIWKTATNAINVGEERTIVDYDATSGVITLSSSLPADITAADTFVIIPVTVANTVAYLANTSTSTLSLSGTVAAADEGTKVQISTQTDGGDGFVTVTGGTANSLNSLLVQNGSGFDLFVENALWQPGMDVIVNDDNTAALNTSIDSVTPNDPSAGIFKLTMADDVSAFTIDQNASVTRRNVLGFNIAPVQGVDPYKFYTGLLRRVQVTVDGLESDQAFSGIRAAGIQVDVAGPIVQQVLFEIDIVLVEGIAISSIIDDIKNAVSSYVKSLKVSEDIILTEIIERIQGIVGVKDLTIISPPANVPIADREIASVSENDITIG